MKPTGRITFTQEFDDGKMEAFTDDGMRIVADEGSIISVEPIPFIPFYLSTWEPTKFDIPEPPKPKRKLNISPSAKALITQADKE